MQPLPELAADCFTGRDFTVQVSPADFTEERVQRILAHSERADQKPALIHRQIDSRPLLHLGLGGEGPRNPQAEAVTPLLNLGLHRPPPHRIYNEYTPQGPWSSDGRRWQFRGGSRGGRRT